MKNRSENLDIPANGAVTVGVAAKYLGLSVKSLKRLSEVGKLRSFRTEGGHVRFLRADLDAYRQSRQSRVASVGSPAPVGASSVLQTKREQIEGINLDVQEIRAKNELRKAQELEAEIERNKKRESRARILVTRATLTREENERSRQQAENARAAFVNKWRRWMFVRSPDWASPQQRQCFESELQAAISQCDPSQGDQEISEFLETVIQRVMEPWLNARFEKGRIEKLIEQKARELPPQGATESDRLRAISAGRTAVSALPAGCEVSDAIEKAIEPIGREIIQRQVLSRRNQLIDDASGWSVLGFSATAEEKAEATAAVRLVLSGLSLQASQQEEQTLMAGAIAPIRRRIEERAAAEQRKTKIERAKSGLMTFAWLRVSNYLDEESIDLDYSQKVDLEREVRRGLGEELTGEESQREADEIALEIADEQLGKMEVD